MHSSQTGPSIPARRARAIESIANSTANATSLAASASTLDDTAPHLDDATPAIGLIDLDHIADAYEQLTSAFASDNDVLHAVACKAVPLQPLLRCYAEAGAGCEVASPGELELAITAGFPPESIVFDSPAKTMAELHRAVELGVSMNVDNFDELERLDAILEGRMTSAKVGIRINPQSGTGTIGALSTATQTSKFGIGLADPGAREALIEAYLARPWLTQIHVHSGSQGISLDQAAAGVRAIVELVQEINAHAASLADASSRADASSQDSAPTSARAGARSSARQITRIDIGGGLPVNFAGEDITPTFADYRAALQTQVPELFDFDIVTEFGRALLAKAGTILTRVEYAKTTGGRRIAMTHAGVQVATRTAYAPDDWPLRILPFSPNGSPKSAEAVPTDVAGPACFAGDLLARDRMLPRLDAGDLVAVPDTGAYYFSNPFSYNLLPRVPVFGYRAANDDGELEFVLIRRGQTIAEVLAEAGEPDGAPLTSRTRKVGENRAKRQGAFAPN